MNVPAHVVVHRTERLFLEMTIILKPSWSFRGYIEANLGYIDAMLCYIIEVIWSHIEVILELTWGLTDFQEAY